MIMLNRATITSLLLAFLAVAAAPSSGLAQSGGSQSSAPMLSTRVDEMPPQMRRAYIIGIQEELEAHGYYVGQVDGVIGKRTKGAIRQYQRDAGLPVDAVATKELLDHLKFAAPKVYARGRTAQSSNLVASIQTELQRRGYYQGPLDGLVGPMTRAAVEAFELDAGLPPTGRVGSGVLNELKQADPSIRRN